MTLIIILICLGLDRYLNLGGVLARFNWFDAYIRLVDKYYKPGEKAIAWIRYAIVVGPLLLLMLLLYFLFFSILDVIGMMILATITLIYCLGPVDLHHEFAAYNKAIDAGAGDSVQAFESSWGIAADSDTKHRDLSKKIFVAANDRIFGVVFWFLLLGPIAALWYRINSLLVQQDNVPAKLILNIMDWAPVRLEGLFYGLVGDFSAIFGCWFRRVFMGFKSSREILTECSLRALDIDAENTSGSLAENTAALQLVDRGVIVGLVLVAVFTLGSWLA